MDATFLRPVPAQVAGWRLDTTSDRSGAPPWSFEVRAKRSDAQRVVVRGRWRPPSFAGPAWIECSIVPDAEDALVEAVFQRLGEGGAPGTRLMLSVEGDVGTMRALAFGVPPACTREGALLWLAGARWMKSWYFPEGGLEGGEKIQGNIPLDAANRRRVEDAVRADLRKFLGGHLAEAFPDCAARAEQLVSEVATTPTER